MPVKPNAIILTFIGPAFVTYQNYTATVNGVNLTKQFSELGARPVVVGGPLPDLQGLLFDNTQPGRMQVCHVGLLTGTGIVMKSGDSDCQSQGSGLTSVPHLYIQWCRPHWVWESQCRVEVEGYGDSSSNCKPMESLTALRREKALSAECETVWCGPLLGRG